MDTPKKCPSCGGAIPPDSPGGWCVRCSLERALTNDAQEKPSNSLSLLDIPQPGAEVSYVGDYELIEVIAHGGMGVVYQARQKKLNRVVALKLLLGGAHASEDFKRRFRQEAEMAAKLQHPNIVPIYEIGEHAGQPYFSMEYVAGSNLAELARDQPLPARKAAEYTRIVAEAVAYAHARGVVHRDLKPANILIGLDERPRVSDFGLARQLDVESSLTLSGEVLGTPGYLPPEQASTRSGAIGPASDVYALGAILYHLLTGRPPFLAGTLAEVLQQVLHREPVPLRQLNPAVPRDLETITLKCLEKDPQRRYPEAGALAADLERYLRNEPILARAPSQVYKFRKLVGRNKVAFIGGAALAVSLLIGFTVSTSLFFREKAARLKATQAEQRALDEAAKSREVAQFLKTMLQGVGPSKALGRDTTMLQEILDQTSARIGKDLTNQPAVEAELRATLGSVYSEIGFYDKAEAMERKALEIRTKLRGNDHVEIADSLLGLAGALHRQGKDAEAEATCRELLVRFRNQLDDRHVATILRRLASILADREKYGEAEALRREALAMLKKSLGPEHRLVAEALGDLSFSLADKGELVEAEKLAREELAMRRKLQGNENPDVAASLADLAALLIHQENYAEAEALARESLALDKKLGLHEHPNVAITLKTLGSALRHQGKLAEAETSLREALAMNRKLLDAESPAVDATLFTLASVIYSQGKLAEAEAMYLEAVATRKKLFGEEDSMVALTFNQLGHCVFRQGRITEAETFFREAAAMLKRRGEDPQDIAEALNDLANSLVVQGRLTEAEGFSREALATLRKTMDEAHSEDPGLVAALNELVENLNQQGKSKEAEPLAREALTITRKNWTHDPGSWVTSIEGLVGALCGGHKYAEAEGLFPELLPPSITAQPESAGLFQARGGFRARRGQFHEAIADLTKALQLEPTNAPAQAGLILLLAHTGDATAYRQSRELLTIRYGDVADTPTAARIAKACLVIPAQGDALAMGVRMADLAVATGKEYREFAEFQLAKALAEYRQGRFVTAAEWSRKALANADTHMVATAVASEALLAMAERELKELPDARNSLAHAANAAKEKLPTVESGDLGVQWPEWLLAQLVLAEARLAIENN